MKRGEFEKRLRQAAPFVGLDDTQMQALWLHYDLLRRWNPRINLTRVIELDAAVRFHYAESLFVGTHVPRHARSVIDVGSGAGFPGFVLAVARPELEVTLLESDLRKAAFLREASDLVTNVRVLSQRSRDVIGSWDVAVSRAVRAEDVLEFSKRAARWVMLVGTEPPKETPREGWQQIELPDGKGRLWIHAALSASGVPKDSSQ